MADLNSEHKRWPILLWLLGVLFTIIVGQVALIVWAGISYVPIKSGYYEPAVSDQSDATSSSRERLLWLEKQLAPPPLLVWSDAPPEFDFAATLDNDEQTETLASNQTDDIQANDDGQANNRDDMASLSVSDVVGDDIQSEPETIATTQNLFTVSPDYIKHLPDLRMMDVEERKETFIASVLPLILRANEELLMRRQIIKRDYAQGNEARLRRWAELYLIDDIDESGDIDALYAALMLRVDMVPVSLALSQAIVESGWGTSRFARQGNALFGQWAWSEHKGIKPYEPSNDRAVVRSFPSLFDSVRAYMHNLNTHFAYADWRDVRIQNRDLDHNTLTMLLIPKLERYSEDGQIYIRKLGNIIRTNNLQYYNAARLSELN